MNLLKDLNPEQLAAVTLPPQHAMILAGAGSGKTRVLTTRIAWLITTGQVSPQGVLAVTFTNKAAKEMLTRLASLITVNTRGMWVGTFHGLCNRLLRAHHRDAALPATFQILDSADQLASIKRLLKNLDIDEDRYPPKNLMYFINSCKEEGLRAAEVEVNDDYNRRFVELYAAYDDQCQREGVVDFAELLLRSYELLERNLPLRQHYQARFRHVLIDEFQDTNNLQYKWLKLLAGQGNAFFAVGDDDQSIYAFRGANIGNMASFEREFGVGNLIRLEQNYRSHGHILDCANFLIRNNSRRLGKNLWTESGTGEPVRIFEALTDQHEAQWLIEQVNSLIGEGMERSDIAVLYRSNAQSRVLEHALFNAGIPYRVYGGLRFFERAEIKHALAYLRLMENPDDDTAFLRVVNFPARGIGARTVETLQDHARAQGLSLYRAVSTVPGSSASKLVQFVRLIESMRFDTQSLSLADAVEHVVEKAGLIQHYLGEKEGQERIENLRELKTAAASFEAEQGIALDTPANLGVANAASDASPALAPATAQIASAQVSPLAAFLAHASLEAGENQASEGVSALQLMTVHAAKGLEFNAVFVTGLEEGLFPHENSSAEVDGLEEERRLMYVALTRARQRLFLSFSQTRQLHGQTRYHLKSRFIDELPEDAVKWLSASHAANPYRWSNASLAHGAAPAALGVARSQVAKSPWRIGQLVRHAKFGEGVVVNLEGQGSDLRIQINFGAQGVKWLALSVAKLEAA